MSLDCCFPQLQSERDRNLVRIVQLSVLAAVLLRHHHTLVTEYVDTACSPAAAAPAATEAQHTPGVWRWIAVQLPRIPSISEVVPGLRYGGYSLGRQLCAAQCRAVTPRVTPRAVVGLLGTKYASYRHGLGSPAHQCEAPNRISLQTAD